MRANASTERSLIFCKTLSVMGNKFRIQLEVALKLKNGALG
jgi:hypothetical protein